MRWTAIEPLATARFGEWLKQHSFSCGSLMSHDAKVAQIDAR